MPLTTHVLPGGRMALRIFEARYIRMVKEAMKGERSFIMCMLNANGDKESNKHIFDVGCHVRIVDFDQGADGLLGITVEGLELVNVNGIETERDNLRSGICNVVAWQTEQDICVQDIGSKLRSVFDSYPELANLYDDKPFDDHRWVIMRWLELIPISSSEKQGMLTQANYRKVADYLNQLIQ